MSEERQALGQLIEAFPGSTVGVTIANGETPPRDIDDPAFDEPEEGELVPTNFARLLADGIPEGEYVLFPYLPKAARVWAFGPAESSKTIWTQWVASKVTHEGREVVLVSAENPLETDVRQLSRLRPNWGRCATCLGRRQLDAYAAKDRRAAEERNERWRVWINMPEAMTARQRRHRLLAQTQPEQPADADSDPLELARECPSLLASIRFGLNLGGRGRLAEAEELVRRLAWGPSDDSRLSKPAPPSTSPLRVVAVGRGCTLYGISAA